MRVLITGASTFFAPPLIRNFGMRSVEVTAADSRWISMGKAARHASRRLLVPLLSRDPAGYLDALVRELHARNYDLLLPAFEEALLLAEYRNELEPFTRLLLPDFDAMWQVHFKPGLHRLCQDLDIPTPPTVVPESPTGLVDAVGKLQFPVVLKLPAANNCVGRSFCDNIPELMERFERLSDHELERGSAPPFVQQKIDGDPIYTLMLCDSGRKLGEVIYRPLRTYPEQGGTSAHRESIEHPEIAALTARLAAATEWSGFLGLDFLVDRTDGTPYVIDANPRANPGIQLGYLAGVDWTGILIDVLEGRPCPTVLARPGVRTRSILLDLGWLFEGFRPQAGWIGKVRHRLREYQQPAWELAEQNELIENGDWRSAVALGYQAIGAALKSLLTGRPVNQTMLDDVNYDAVAAQRLRLLKQAPARAESRSSHPATVGPLRKSA
jgi:predicted ATP-grasp superfamily ATP-dependent carboligase